VHFPTDLNLLWDSGRKALETLQQICKKVQLSGWRKSKHLLRNLKNAYRKASEIHRKKGHDFKERLIESVSVYLVEAERIADRMADSLLFLMKTLLLDETTQNLVESLKYYQEMLLKHIDLVMRRILNEEVIPHSEKVFSIFEPHVEWLAKGKTNCPIEIGHHVMVTTDQFQFMIAHKVLIKETDKEQPEELAKNVKNKYIETGFYSIGSSSFDRGFYSAKNELAWTGICELVVMPKPGKKTESRIKFESAAGFTLLRKKHSAVESNINELEYAGLDRVPDRGEDGFKCYVAMAVLGYNIKRLGKLLLEQRQKLAKTA
jgi:IS5 family transposase